MPDGRCSKTMTDSHLNVITIAARAFRSYMVHEGRQPNLLLLPSAGDYSPEFVNDIRAGATINGMMVVMADVPEPIAVYTTPSQLPAPPPRDLELIYGEEAVRESPAIQWLSLNTPEADKVFADAGRILGRLISALMVRVEKPHDGPGPEGTS